MTADREAGGPEPRRDEIRGPRHGLRVPWLALAGVAATVVAAGTLVAGIGDTLSSRDASTGRLLPLQAASPPPADSPDPASPTAEASAEASAGASAEATPEQPGPPSDRPSDPPSDPPPETRLHDALLRLRSSVYQGAAEGDVRDDVALDLTNVIEGILRQPWSPLARRRADVASLQHKISTRTREGAISDHRAAKFQHILDAAEI